MKVRTPKIYPPDKRRTISEDNSSKIGVKANSLEKEMKPEARGEGQIKCPSNHIFGKGSVKKDIEQELKLFYLFLGKKQILSINIKFL